MLARILRHRPGALAGLVFILALAAPGAASAATAAPRLVPVWAYIDGHTPIRGAAVTVVGPDGPVAQANGARTRRTNANGVAVLSYAGLPRRFTLVVRGGRAAGRRLTGGQRSQVTRYGGRARVLEVNPLSTVATRVHEERPRLTVGRSRVMVKRYFRVPRWADLGEDLRSSPRWFSARVYLRAVRRQGSVARLTRVVARRVLRRGRSVRRGGPYAAPRAIAVAAVTPKDLIKKIFKKLLGTALEIKTQELVGGALGGLLQFAKSLGLDLTTKSELDGVRAQLDELTTQVTRLEGKVDEVSKAVAHNHASQLLHQTDDIIGQINHAQAQLSLLARLDPKDPTQKGFAESINTYIHRNLEDAPTLINQKLKPTPALGDNVFKAISRALAARDRFFDQRDSAEIESVYDYFSTAQAELAVILTNYYNANPATYNPAIARALISALEDNVTKQAESLKPAVPAGAFIDTRTPAFMWGVGPDIDALTIVDGKDQTRRDIPLLGFANWQMPATGDMKNLIAGASGKPLDWLRGQLAAPLPHQLIWTSGSITEIVTQRNRRRQLQIRIFDLLTGKEEQHGYGNSDWFYTADCAYQAPCGLSHLLPGQKDFLRSKRGGLLLLRYLRPGEAYYW